MAKNKLETVDFEQALKELDTIVQAMEQGGLSLEQSLAYFEKGIQLTRLCQTALTEAEQKVEILLQDQGLQKLVPFETDELT